MQKFIFTDRPLKGPHEKMSLFSHAVLLKDRHIGLLSKPHGKIPPSSQRYFLITSNFLTPPHSLSFFPLISSALSFSPLRLLTECNEGWQRQQRGQAGDRRVVAAGAGGRRADLPPPSSGMTAVRGSALPNLSSGDGDGGSGRSARRSAVSPPTATSRSIAPAFGTDDGVRICRLWRRRPRERPRPWRRCAVTVASSWIPPPLVPLSLVFFDPGSRRSWGGGSIGRGSGRGGSTNNKSNLINST